ncbi:MAG: HEAT repeat domain-containing protein [Planctomycetota bacterium]
MPALVHGRPRDPGPRRRMRPRRSLEAMEHPRPEHDGRGRGDRIRDRQADRHRTLRAGPRGRRAAADRWSVAGRRRDDGSGGSHRTDRPSRNDAGGEGHVLAAQCGGRPPADRACHRVRSDPQPIVRATAFEALEGDPDALYEAAPFGLIDENRGVRFVAAMSVGDAGLAGLAPLISPLLSDPSDSVRAAAIYAMNRIGEGADPSPLAAMARSDDPEVRANAYLVLGLLGNPSAIPLIESTLGKGMRLVNPMRVRLTELQAAEALVLLGDQDDIEPIRAALFTPVEQGEITVLACDMLGRLGDEQARAMLFRMIAASGNQTRPPEIRMAATASLFRLGPPLPEDLENLILSQVDDRDPRRRVQAAACLAVVPGQKALAALEGLLADGEPMVRTAAAGAILSRSDSRQAAAAAVSN